MKIKYKRCYFTSFTKVHLIEILHFREAMILLPHYIILNETFQEYLH